MWPKAFLLEGLIDVKQRCLTVTNEAKEERANLHEV